MLTKKEISSKYLDKHTQKKVQNPSFRIGNFLDIKDSFGHWRVAKFLSSSAETIHVMFDGWGQQYNEVILIWFMYDFCKRISVRFREGFCLLEAKHHLIQGVLVITGTGISARFRFRRQRSLLRRSWKGILKYRYRKLTSSWGESFMS